MDLPSRPTRLEQCPPGQQLPKVSICANFSSSSSCPSDQKSGCSSPIGSSPCSYGEEVVAVTTTPTPTTIQILYFNFMLAHVIRSLSLCRKYSPKKLIMSRHLNPVAFGRTSSLTAYRSNCANFCSIFEKLPVQQDCYALKRQVSFCARQ